MESKKKARENKDLVSERKCSAALNEKVENSPCKYLDSIAFHLFTLKMHFSPRSIFAIGAKQFAIIHDLVKELEQFWPICAVCISPTSIPSSALSDLRIALQRTKIELYLESNSFCFI